jgi:glycosyltransferase involved in cell wall biosynthesis
VPSRVALVTSLHRGGPLEHALELASGLSARGCGVLAVCAAPEIAARFEAAGARAEVLPLRHQLDLPNGLAVRRAVAGADVVHAQDRRAGLWTRALPRPGNAALVYSVHGLPDPFLPPPVGRGRPGLRAVLAYRGLDAGLARRADAVVTPSRAVAVQLERRLGYPPGRIRVIPNGVRIGPPPQGPHDLVGTLSVLDPVKDLPTFLRAAALLARDRPELRFAVFGEGPERERLVALAAELGLGDAVAFPGHVPAAEALGRLRILVLPSLMENAPMAMLEAMAACVPVVASHTGGIPEVAPPSTPLVAPGDAGAFATAVGHLLADPALAERAAAEARAHVAAELSADRMTERFAALYEEVTACR